ncbi:hypothetical protein CRG98_017892 [Punica granatum]|uniref:Uncharacterized protein n=1 Tax=Punica granatum TaxID=22663 RepID=A0A2I0JZB9_PUNGR|nr:hypothetical protein CRG98_017892 [Punica granatum]
MVRLIREKRDDDYILPKSGPNTDRVLVQRPLEIRIERRCGGGVELAPPIAPPMTSKTMTRTKTKAMVMARKAYGRTSWLSPSREVMTVVAAPSVEVQNTHPKGRRIEGADLEGRWTGTQQRVGFTGPSDRRGGSRGSSDWNSSELAEERESREGRERMWGKIEKVQKM